MPLDVGAADVLEIVQRVGHRERHVEHAWTQGGHERHLLYISSLGTGSGTLPYKHKVPLRSQQVQLDDDLMTTDDDCGSLGRPGGGRDLAVCDDLSWSPVNSSTAALLAARSNTFNPLDSDAA